MMRMSDQVPRWLPRKTEKKSPRVEIAFDNCSIPTVKFDAGAAFAPITPLKQIEYRTWNSILVLQTTRGSHLHLSRMNG